MRLISNAEVERQFLVDAEVVLAVNPIVVSPAIGVFASGRDTGGVRQAQQKVSHGISAEEAVEGVFTQVIAAEERGDVGSPEFADVHTNFGRVPTVDPAEVVTELPGVSEGQRLATVAGAGEAVDADRRGAGRLRSICADALDTCSGGDAITVKLPAVGAKCVHAGLVRIAEAEFVYLVCRSNEVPGYNHVARIERGSVFAKRSRKVGGANPGYAFVGEPPENVVPGAENMVDANIVLVVVVPAGRGEAVVGGCNRITRDIGQGIESVEQLFGNGVDRDLVTRIRGVVRRVDDRGGDRRQVAISPGGGRDRGVGYALYPVTETFPGGEEEGLVFDDGATTGKSDIVRDFEGCADPVGKEVTGVEGTVLVEPDRLAVVLVGSCPRSYGYIALLRELGVIAEGTDLELRDGVRRREHFSVDAVGSDIDIGNTVDRCSRLERHAAADGEPRTRTICLHSGREGDGVEHAVGGSGADSDWHVVDFVYRAGVGNSGDFGFDDLAGFGDLHLSSGCRDLQLAIHADHIPCAQQQVLGSESEEAGHLELNFIGSGVQIDEGIAACSVAFGKSQFACLFGPGGNLCTVHHSIARVGDGPPYLAEDRLCMRACCGHAQDNC